MPETGATDYYDPTQPAQPPAQPVEYGFGEYNPYNLHDLRNRPQSRGGLAPDSAAPGNAAAARDPLEILLDQVRRSPSGDNVQRLQRLLALQTIPARTAGIGEGILQQSRLAEGSPQEVFTQFSDQISQIQSQLRQTSQTIARRGGFNVGLQRQRLQGANVGQAASRLQDLFTQGALQGRQGVLQIATGVRPVLAAQVPAPRESVEAQPFNYAFAGQATATLAEQLERLFSGGGGGGGGGRTNFVAPVPAVPYTPPTVQYPQYLDPYSFSAPVPPASIPSGGGGFG